MTNEIRATFETRRSAELAVEHLVQEHGLARTAIVVGTEGAANSSGTARSGGDAADPSSDSQPKLRGAIELVVNYDGASRDVVEGTLKEAGATLQA